MLRLTILCLLFLLALLTKHFWRSWTRILDWILDIHPILNMHRNKYVLLLRLLLPFWLFTCIRNAAYFWHWGLSFQILIILWGVQRNIYVSQVNFTQLSVVHFTSFFIICFAQLLIPYWIKLMLGVIGDFLSFSVCLWLLKMHLLFWLYPFAEIYATLSIKIMICLWVWQTVAWGRGRMTSVVKVMIAWKQFLHSIVEKEHFILELIVLVMFFLDYMTKMQNRVLQALYYLVVLLLLVG